MTKILKNLTQSIGPQKIWISVIKRINNSKVTTSGVNLFPLLRYSKEEDMDDMERDLGDEYGWKQVEINEFMNYRLIDLLVY